MAEQKDNVVAAKFVVDGVEYDVPMLASLGMEEALLFYGYAKISPLDVDELNPEVMAALLHIAIKRGRPELKDKGIRELLGGVNFQDLMVGLAEAFEGAKAEEEEKERPPTSPTPPGAESEPDVVGNKSEPPPSIEPGSNGSSDHSPDLSDLSPTGAPV